MCFTLLHERILVPVLALALLGAVPVTVGPGERSVPESARAPFEDDRPAPDFTRETISGETFTLSHHRGEVVVLNFWATWCPPCRREIPDFVDLQDEYAEADLRFVGVALDVDDVAKVRRYARHFRVNYPFIVGDGTLVRRYGGIDSVPTSFIIGREGEIRYRVPGRIPKDLLRSVLDKLLDA